MDLMYIFIYGLHLLKCRDDCSCFILRKKIERIAAEKRNIFNYNSRIVNGLWRCAYSRAKNVRYRVVFHKFSTINYFDLRALVHIQYM